MSESDVLSVSEVERHDSFFDFRDMHNVKYTYQYQLHSRHSHSVSVRRKMPHIRADEGCFVER